MSLDEVDEIVPELCSHEVVPVKYVPLYKTLDKIVPIAVRVSSCSERDPGNIVYDVIAEVSLDY